MDTFSGGFMIIGILALVLFLGAAKNKAEWMINFILRGVLGMVMVYFVNYFLSGRVQGIEIGYNLVTFVTSGILGIPGVMMLYGINFYMIL